MIEIFQQTFGQVCHQDPARTIWCDGRDLAICWRCAGLYLGFIVGWLFLALSRRRSAQTLETNGSWSLLLGLPILYLHWYIGAEYGYVSSGPERLFFGLLGGLCYGAWLCSMAHLVHIPRPLLYVPIATFSALFLTTVFSDLQGPFNLGLTAETIIGAALLTMPAIAAVTLVATMPLLIRSCYATIISVRSMDN